VETPAAQAGLQREDVIVAVDGQEVGYPAQLQSRIAQKRPGDRVTIALYRDGQRREVEVRLDQAPLTPQPQRVAGIETAVQERLGIEVAALDPEAAQQLGYDSAEGVVIRNVAPGSPANRAGVFVGQRLRQVDRQPVESVEDAQRLLEGLAPGDIVGLIVESPGGGGERVVNLRVPR
jgi:serine protease Do